MFSFLHFHLSLGFPPSPLLPAHCLLSSSHGLSSRALRSIDGTTSLCLSQHTQNKPRALTTPSDHPWGLAAAQRSDLAHSDSSDRPHQCRSVPYPAMFFPPQLPASLFFIIQVSNASSSGALAPAAILTRPSLGTFSSHTSVPGVGLFTSVCGGGRVCLLPPEGRGTGCVLPSDVTTAPGTS